MKSPYTIILRYSPEEDIYIATIPELPGCMADGPTPETALKEAETAIEAWLSEAARIGRIIPRSDLSIDTLIAFSPLLNITDLARRIGIPSRTLHSKIEKKTPLTPAESRQITGILEDMGLAVIK